TNRTPLGRLASEEDILNAVRFFLGEGSGMVTGQVLLVDGGISS
ncbi:MAG: SDR family oxidoreductase, partial [Pseudomonadota bacterium]|nr:SDR family oxidoreductase [Pseudomonadota bacterium]